MVEHLANVVKDLTALPPTSIAALVPGPVEASDSQVVDNPNESVSLDDVKMARTWKELIEHATPILAKLATLSGDALAKTKESDARGAGAAGRVRVAAILAQEMRPDVERLAELGEKIAAVVRRLDPLVASILRARDTDPACAIDENTEQILSEIFPLVVASQEAQAQLAEVASRVNDVAKFARLLRPVLRYLQRGLLRFADARAIYDDWGLAPDR